MYKSMCDKDIFEKAVNRAVQCGIYREDLWGIIVFLEKEIDALREKINDMERVFDAQNRIVANLKRCGTNDPTTCEAVKQNVSASEIIKALAENDYNTITINCYKDIESEG